LLTPRLPRSTSGRREWGAREAGVPTASHDRGDEVTSGVSQTQAEAAVMQQTAAKFEQVDQSLQSMLSGLMAQLEVLQQAWRGAGGRSFEQVKQQWAQDQASLQRALRETAGAIRTAGQQYDVSDTEAASRVSTTNRGGIQLPL
jgi:WXG100 family type VII secretion target